MHCNVERDRLFRLMDDELAPSEEKELRAHLATCAQCSHEYDLLSVTRRVGHLLPTVEPSPYFYTKLRARIDSERRTVTIWQLLLGLSHRMVPALALVTLMLLGVFAYDQMKTPDVDIYQAYDRVFMSTEHSHRMVIADQGEITEDSVVYALAEEEPNTQSNKVMLTR